MSLCERERQGQKNCDGDYLYCDVFSSSTLQRGGSRKFSSVLTCFSSSGLSIPSAFLKRTAFCRSFCQSRSTGGLLFLGLEWRSSFTAGFFLLVTNSPDSGFLWSIAKLTKLTKTTSLKTGWGHICACELGWCPVSQSRAVSLSLWPLLPLWLIPAGQCLWVVQGLTRAWRSQFGMQPLGERIQPFVSCIMRFHLTGHELSLFLHKWLVKIHPLYPLAGGF